MKSASLGGVVIGGRSGICSGALSQIGPEGGENRWRGADMVSKPRFGGEDQRLDLAELHVHKTGSASYLGVCADAATGHGTEPVFTAAALCRSRVTGEHPVYRSKESGLLLELPDLESMKKGIFINRISTEINIAR